MTLTEKLLAVIAVSLDTFFSGALRSSMTVTIGGTSPIRATRLNPHLLTRQNSTEQRRRPSDLTLPSTICYVCGAYHHGGIIHEIGSLQVDICFVCFGWMDDLPDIFLTLIAFFREDS